MARKPNRAVQIARAARRLEKLQQADAKAKIAAARLETARLRAETKKVEADTRRAETEAAQERLRIRAEGKAERDQIAPRLNFVEKRDILREQARDFIATGHKAGEPPPLVTERQVLTDGRIVETPIMGRDGQPMREKPPEAPTRKLSPQAQAHLKGYSGTGGFWDPYGTIAEAISKESGHGRVHVCGHWPGGFKQ